MVSIVSKIGFTALLAGGLAVLGSSSAFADAAPVPVSEPASGSSVDGKAATEFVRKKHDELQAAVKVAKDPKTDPKLLGIFETMLDYDSLSRDSLGDDWTSLTPPQQKEFSEILKQLVQNSYRKNLRDPSSYAVQYTGTDAGNRGTLVKTLAQSKANKREKALAIDYVVTETAGGLKVRDVITDGVSLVANYRNQFKRMLKKRGFDGLLEQMRKQLDK